MKLKIIKSVICFSILAIYSCTGITMEQNNNRNIMNQGNNNVVENTSEENDDGPVFRPVLIRLNRRNIIKRPQNPELMLLTEEEQEEKFDLEKELKKLKYPNEIKALEYIDKWIEYIDRVLEKSKKSN